MQSKNRRPRIWTERDFEVRPSKIPQAGLGLFAKCLIEPEDTIGPYTGKVLTDAQANSHPYVRSLYLVWVCKDCWILGEGGGSNYTRYINHSERRPNCQLVTSSRWKKARVMAIRLIEPGEEIYFDYGQEYWDIVSIQKQETPT